jgi:hypothetical protein
VSSADPYDWRGRAKEAEAKLARIREEAEEWAALAPADDWGESVVDTFKADVGRALLNIISDREPQQ